jgi:septal ring factor EnvC (AmiA/AmiB activator)
MSTISKVFTVLNLVFSLVVVGTIGSMLSHTEDWRAKHAKEVEERAKQVDDLNKKIESANGDRNNYEAKNRDLTNQLADARSELTNATATADQLRNDNSQLRGSVDGIQASLKAVETQLGDVEARNKALMEAETAHRATAATAEKDKLDAQDDRARIEGELKRANDDIAAKEKQIAELDATLGNLRAEREALVKMGMDIDKLVGGAIPQIPAKVSAVGEGFVVLSVGQNEGVQIGYPFDVYRGDRYVGRVLVEHVLPDSATARITMKNGDLAFQAGDAATTRL